MRGPGGNWGVVLTLVLCAGSLSAQVVINELLAVNATGALDEQGLSSDWLELVNIGETTVSLLDYSLTDDPGEPRRWLLPDIDLEPGEPLLVWCSGKDLVRATPERVIEGSVGFVPALVRNDVEWSFLPGDSAAIDPSFPEGWFEVGFDDSAWQSGEGAFGFGEAFLTTTFPKGTSGFLLRHRFDVPEPDQLDELYLQVVYDDAFIAYLNGQELLRVNVPEGEIDFVTRAVSSHEGDQAERFLLTDDQRRMLCAGENVLAVAAVNRSLTSNDMVLSLEMGEAAALLHTNFRLSSAGETVLLVGPDGRVASRVDLPPQVRDRSYGRPDPNLPVYAYLLHPTPGSSNDTRSSATLIPSQPHIEPASGEYSSGFDATVWFSSFRFDNVEVRYTLDGSEPTAESSFFEGAIPIEENTIVRAAVFLDGEVISEPATRVYFLDADAYDLPIVSVAFDDFSLVHTGGARETEGHVSILSPSGRLVAATGMAMRLHGGAGRGGGLETKKSYRMFFRSQYGDAALNYRVVFETAVDRFDKLVFRGGFNDAFRTGSRAAFIRDQVIRDVHGDMGGVHAHGAWYNLFVNMEYRGIYNVTERLDKQFLASYFPEEGDNWFVINTGENVLDGGEEARVAWEELKRFFREADLTDDAAFEEAGRVIDIEDYTRYMIVNIWAQNHDWPHNNWSTARPSRPGGKWIFFCWDTEWGFGLTPRGFEGNTMAQINDRGDAPIALPFLRLLRRVEYQKRFIADLEEYLEGPLSSDNVLPRVIAARELIADDVHEETELPSPSGDFEVETWESNADDVERFAIERPKVLRSIVLTSPLLTFPRATQVNPRAVVPEGEIELRINGRGFSEHSRVYFNGVESPALRLNSSTSLMAVLPFDLVVEGEPSIIVDDPECGPFTSERLLTVSFLRPQPERLSPDRGLPSGGEEIFVLGDGFSEGVRVEFGGVPAAAAELVDRQTIRVVTPQAKAR
ncbi:MAG: CotH kinase family protein [Planctomycetes bacterium]|nr:CotH kinase family protein [Planctomycetota bacterium]